jgi:hypothetical protein
MKKCFLILLVTQTLNSPCFAQSHPDTTFHGKGWMNSLLVDSNSGIKYVLDSSRTFITAYKKNGKILWRTNPQKENNIKLFMYSDSSIYYFYFYSDKSTGNIEQILIAYGNSYEGFINKKTGKFTFFGQD